ncbi:MAG TPA: methyltransferase domain-containing protein [Vicinamibacterales bacterium]|nr:methyltransferase domain-containing protein [Vicinamibacterales bacterium]
MFGWFRREAARPGTALAMIGARASDHVLFLGARDASVAAESGTITRLNGRTVVVGRGEDDAARADQAAAKAGAIVEFVDAPLTELPFAASTFKIVVIHNLAMGSTETTSTLGEATRVLQPGGRIILMFGETARGVFGSLNPPPPPESDSVVNLLIRAGLVAARRLAVSEGVTYFEARKARD